MPEIKSTQIGTLPVAPTLSAKDKGFFISVGGELQRFNFGDIADALIDAGYEFDHSQQFTDIDNRIGDIVNIDLPDIRSRYADIDDLDLALTDAENRLTGAEDRLNTAETQLTGIDGIVQNHSTLISQNDSEILLKASLEELDSVDQKVTDAQASISVQADQIASKVAESTYNILEGRVTDAESSIVQNANKISLKVDETTYETLEGTVQDNSASITLNNNAISSKVEQSVFNTLDQSVQTNTTDISQNLNSISLKASQQQVDDIDGELTATSDLVAGLETSVGTNETNISGLDSDLSSVQKDVGTIGARSVLYANANGNIASLDLLSGTEGSVVSIKGSQVNINGDTTFTDDVKIRGTLKGVDGNYSGTLKGVDGYFGGQVSVGRNDNVLIDPTGTIPTSSPQLGISQSLALPSNSHEHAGHSGANDQAYRFRSEEPDDNHLFEIYSGQIPVQYPNQGIRITTEIKIDFGDRDLLPYGYIFLQGKMGTGGWNDIASATFNGAEIQQGFKQVSVSDATYNYDYVRLKYRWYNITDNDSVYFRVRDNITAIQYETKTIITDEGIFVAGGPSGYRKLGVSSFGNSVVGGGGTVGTAGWNNISGKPFSSFSSDFAVTGGVASIKGDLFDGRYYQAGDSPSFDNLSLKNDDLGQGNVGNGIDFGPAGIYRLQQSSDPDSSGLAFYTHPSATNSDPQTLALVLNKFGNADFKQGLSRDGNTVWDAGNLDVTASYLESIDQNLGQESTPTFKRLTLSESNASTDALIMNNTNIVGANRITFNDNGEGLRYPDKTSLVYDGDSFTTGVGFTANNRYGTWFDARVSNDSGSNIFRGIDSGGNTVGSIHTDNFNGNGGGYLNLEGDWRADELTVGTLHTTLFKPETIQGMGAEFAFTDVAKVNSTSSSGTRIYVDASAPILSNLSKHDWVVVSSGGSDSNGFYNVYAEVYDIHSNNIQLYNNTIGGDIANAKEGYTVMRISGNYIYADGTTPTIQGYTNVSNYSESPFGGNTKTPSFEISPKGIFYDAMGGVIDYKADQAGYETNAYISTSNDQWKTKITVQGGGKTDYTSQDKKQYKYTAKYGINSLIVRGTLSVSTTNNPPSFLGRVTASIGGKSDLSGTTSYSGSEFTLVVDVSGLTPGQTYTLGINLYASITSNNSVGISDYSTCTAKLDDSLYLREST